MVNERRQIFVFGSNLAGRHGAGSALAARLYHGAVYGQGVGFQGESYAIPTKDALLNTLSLTDIENYVNEFLWFAGRHLEMDFNVVAIGCGLAGYAPEQIAPFFDFLPGNVNLPPEFKS